MKPWINMHYVCKWTPKIPLYNSCSPLQYVGLQAVDKVFSKVNHLRQCGQYQFISVVICVEFWVVVLHRKDAELWNTQRHTEFLDLNLNNFTFEMTHDRRVARFVRILKCKAKWNPNLDNNSLQLIQSSIETYLLLQVHALVHVPDISLDLCTGQINFGENGQFGNPCRYRAESESIKIILPDYWTHIVKP